MALHLKKEVEQGKNIVIYDFDGPRKEDGSITCMEVTEDLLREKINEMDGTFNCIILCCYFNFYPASKVGPPFQSFHFLSL